MDNKTMYIGIGIVALVVVIIGISLSGSQQPSQINAGNNMMDGNEMNEEMTNMEEEMQEMMEGDVRIITVDGNEFRFNPGEISVKKGERVRIVFRNTGNLPHDFVIEGTGIRTKIINPGQTDVIEFTASETRTYTFYCSVGSHRQQGMEGTLSIS